MVYKRGFPRYGREVFEFEEPISWKAQALIVEWFQTGKDVVKSMLESGIDFDADDYRQANELETFARNNGIGRYSNGNVNRG